MKRKYREAMRTAQRLQDAYIDGVTDDEAAAETQTWHDEHVPEYPASTTDHHLDEHVPF